ncbi:MAG: NAD(P)H-hydrate dehydratase [Deltaproteobacteria bacterium]|nr:NAD(P)H-hydrate dehydratase [Deltaproteobacteria bacterium]
MYLVTADEMREMDRETIETFGLPGRILMENAGRLAARVLMNTFRGLSGRRVGVVAGRGNNGGDGFVVARYLKQKDIPVTVYLLCPRDKVQGDAAANLKLLSPMAVPVIEITDSSDFQARQNEMQTMDLWVDAILGTGLKSDVKGFFKEVIEFLNSTNKPIFSVDIPSGLDSDTGQVRGLCIRSHTTATFAFPKIGHILYPGAAYTGRLEIVDIGIPAHIAESVKPAQYLLTTDRVKSYLMPRKPDAHKGNTGHLLVVSGSTGKTGAAAMTATSAVRAGAGLVTLGVPRRLNPVMESLVVEAMTYPLPDTAQGFLDDSAYDPIMELVSSKRCLALGPGVGTAPETARLVQRIVETCPVPMVIDADGLNNLAGHTDILQKTKAPVVLTPHPGEMARLMDTTAQQIQKDRVQNARDFAVRFNVHLVLKGAATVIAHPEGTVYVNTTGNSGMASGGMGDVLTGLIAGFLTQGYSPEAACHLGVYVHGAAADTLAQKVGPFGYLASEVMNAVPGEIKKLMDGSLPTEQADLKPF